MVAKSSYCHGEFSWVDLCSHGMVRARRFYAEVFGWDAVDRDTQGGPPCACFEFQGAAVAGLGELDDAGKARGVPAVWNSYVNVADIDAVTARAADLGATVVVPVMQAADAGRLSFILDPGGATLGFWQRGTHHGAGRINEPGCFCWNELVTRDIEASRAFYGALLGWEFAEYPGLSSTYYVAKAGGRDVAGLLQMTEERGDTPAAWCVYFAVDDAEAATERVRAAGGRVCVEPFDTPVGKVAVLTDPDGAQFSVLHKTAGC